MSKNIRPKRDKLSIKMVYHCILQVHSIFSKISSCLVAAPTSFICCKARLVTRVLSFMCLHNMCITKVVTKSKIITATNRKTSLVKLLKKEFLLGNFEVILICLSFKSKSHFSCNIGEQSLWASVAPLVNQKSNLKLQKLYSPWNT